MYYLIGQIAQLPNLGIHANGCDDDLSSTSFGWGHDPKKSQWDIAVLVNNSKQSFQSSLFQNIRGSLHSMILLVSNSRTNFFRETSMKMWGERIRLRGLSDIHTAD